MASRSRLPLFLAVAGFLVLAFLPGCRTAQRPFNFSVDQGKVPTPPPPGLVEISVDDAGQCKADPEMVKVEFGVDEARAQALWHLPDAQPNDRVVISAKPAAGQDPGNPRRGREIQKLFQSPLEITPGLNAIRSGKPSKTFLLVEQNGAAVWKYNIDYYRGGQKLCTYDPEICVQKLGTTGCQSQ